MRPDGTYLGIEDFCVLDGRRAHGRYDGSYENIARRIADFVSSSALARAREQYALIVAYSCAIENGDAHLPTREQLVRFIRVATAKSERAAVELLDRVAHGVSIAIEEAARYGKQHADARAFADRLIAALTRGLDRLGYKPAASARRLRAQKHSRRKA